MAKALNATTPGSMPYTTNFYYDGQMGFEDDEIHAGGGNVYVTRYGLGARGIEFMETTTNPGGSQTVAASYPLYDGHGNMVATLAKSGSSFTLANQRAYDAWGGIRQGATSGAPRGRYCASLGHVVDDESGLIYMRARYYDQAAGRFVSQDMAHDGFNWFSYASNIPSCFADNTGRSVSPLSYGLGGIGGGFISIAMIIAAYATDPASIALAVGACAIGVALTGLAYVVGDGDTLLKIGAGVISGTITMALLFSAKEIAMLTQMVVGEAAGAKSMAATAVSACFLYSVVLFSMLKEMDWADMGFDVARGLAGM